MAISGDNDRSFSKALAVPQQDEITYPLPIETLQGYAPFGVEPPTPWYLDISGVWKRHRWLFSLTILAAIAAGYLAGAIWSTKYWTVESRLLLNNSSAADERTIYRPMSAQSYRDLVLSEENLDQLAQEFGG